MQMPLTYVILTNYDALDECVKWNVASAMCMIEPCEHLRIMQLVAPQKVVQKPISPCGKNYVSWQPFVLVLQCTESRLKHAKTSSSLPLIFNKREEKSKVNYFSRIVCFPIILWIVKTQKNL